VVRICGWWTGLRGKSEGEQEAALAEFMEGEYRTSFVWEQATPMRMFVHRLKEDEFQCSFSFHHAIMDDGARRA